MVPADAVDVHVVDSKSGSRIKDDILEFEDRQLFLDLTDENKTHNLNDHLHGLSKSATLEINEKSAWLESQGMKIYRFGLGQSPFPVPEIVVEALRQNAHQKDYLNLKGLYELRDEVAKFHSSRIGIERQGSMVMIGPGSKELLFLVQLVFDGDLIVPSPCWVSYIPQALIIGRRIRIIHTNYESKWRMTDQQLEELCNDDRRERNNHPRLLILNYPGNPEGNTYSAIELERIARVARKYNVLILSDEIYGELNFEGNHVSIAQYYPEGTIISSGLSKWCGAGGWRIGTFSFPEKLKWLMDAMAVVASETYTSVSAPIQYAAVTAFRGDPSIDEYLRQSRRILKCVGMWCTRALVNVGVRIHPPKGAFYLFLDFSLFKESLAQIGIDTAKTLTDKLLEETGVAILPASDFARSQDELAARLAYVNFNGQLTLDLAMNEFANKELDEEFLRKACPETIAGIEKLAEWLKNL